MNTLGTWCVVRVDGENIGPMKIENASVMIRKRIFWRKVDAFIMGFWDEGEIGSLTRNPLTKQQRAELKAK